MRVQKNPIKKDNPLLEKWKYNLETWIPKLGSVPIDEIEHESYGGYEWAEGVLFKLKSGQYAIITGSGCSCNSFGEKGDTVRLYQRLVDAQRDFVEWKVEASKTYGSG